MREFGERRAAGDEIGVDEIEELKDEGHGDEGQGDVNGLGEGGEKEE